MPLIFKRRRDAVPPWRPRPERARRQWPDRRSEIRWAWRSPRAAIQTWTQLPWGRQALPLAIRTHLGLVDVPTMREALMSFDDEQLDRFGVFGPDPRGLDEVHEPTLAFVVWADELLLRLAFWDHAESRALVFRLMADGDLRGAARIRHYLHMAESRPPSAPRNDTAIPATDWPLELAAATRRTTHHDKETA